jgi:hypothetical protein
MPTNEQAIKAITALANIIEATAREAGPMGAPSGMVYMAVNGAGINLDTYQFVLDAMVKAGRITVGGDCIKAVA